MWKCEKCEREFTKNNQHHFCKGSAKTIDEYISLQTSEVQVILKRVRALLKEALPDASEKIAWMMPTFWLGENLIHFASRRDYLAIYPGALSRFPFLDQISKYKFTKGAIHFPYNEPIDYDLISRIAQFKKSQILEGQSPYRSNLRKKQEKK